MTPADFADLIRQAAESDDAAAVLDDALQELGLEPQVLGKAAWRVKFRRATAELQAGIARDKADGIVRVTPARLVEHARALGVGPGQLYWRPNLGAGKPDDDA